MKIEFYKTNSGAVRQRWLRLTNGSMHPTQDMFAAYEADGPVWHRSSFVDFMHTDEFYWTHFWCHDAVGQQPYYAVIDNFGNLVKVCDA